jgi:hypothetical protein
MEPIGFAPAPKNRQQRRAAKSSSKTNYFEWPDLWEPDNLELLAQAFLMHINQVPDGIARYKAVLKEMCGDAETGEDL